MTRYGLGRTGWAIVGLFTLLNWYAILPTVGFPAVVAAAVAIPVAAFVWVHFLKTILAAWVGDGQAADAEGDSEPVESYDL